MHVAAHHVLGWRHVIHLRLDELPTVLELVIAQRTYVAGRPFHVHGGMHGVGQVARTVHVEDGAMPRELLPHDHRSAAAYGDGVVLHPERLPRSTIPHLLAIGRVQLLHAHVGLVGTN